MKKHLIIYAKRPLAGYAKTRLGADIGMDASAGVYARMLYTYLIDLIHNLGSICSIELSVTSSDDVDFFKLAFPELSVSYQDEGDLGHRMTSSFQQAFDNGADIAVLTGSDIPGLTSHFITQAFTALTKHLGVIGPASDGGYYLIGMHTPGVPVFNNIDWSTETVLIQTEKRAQQHGVKLFHLPLLTDIDDVVEFTKWCEKNRQK